MGNKTITLINAIKRALTPELLKAKYVEPDGCGHPLAGHCYVASEAYYHIVGKEQGYSPYQMKVDGVSHWWLQQGCSVVDITAKQFDHKINYHHETRRRRAFLTVQPSRRAQVVIDRVQEARNE